MRHDEPLYRSYLLRLWQVQGKRPPAWRAVLESTNGERQGFASLEALFAYLQAETIEGEAAYPGGAGTASPNEPS
jgi:hypothetical protein